ncbi:MAG: sugar phosphate isomerase/epimerase [Planctomycetales bacterium]|nr:sugar phosphate isomerase/epimerase [Planctomycetales bacterium]
MRLGYNTNGYAHHAASDAIAVLASQGYESLALTIDHGFLPPGGSPGEVAAIKDQLRDHDMTCVVETGARFLLDKWTKHEPTLVSTDLQARTKRVDFYRYCIDLAAELGADCVSLWSGIVRDDASADEVLDRLASGLEQVCRHAEAANVDIGFEPEPGMAIDTMGRFARLIEWFDSPRLRLTLDIGHLYCQGEVPLAEPISRWKDRLVNVHLEDMRAGVHEHLMFGDGEIDFPPVLQALFDTGYRGGVHVELSRHSHDAVRASQQAADFLGPIWPRLGREGLGI